MCLQRQDGLYNATWAISDSRPYESRLLQAAEKTNRGLFIPREAQLVQW